MKINGLKFLQDKGWKPDGVFTTDDGRNLTIPANHKAVCLDESGDVVNLTIVSPSPVAFKSGSPCPELRLVGNVSHTQFGWTVKASLA